MVVIMKISIVVVNIIKIDVVFIKLGVVIVINEIVDFVMDYLSIAC